MSNLKDLLDAYDAMSAEKQQNQRDELNTYLEVDDAVDKLQLPSEKEKNSMMAIGMMAGLKFCPHCKKNVSPMSKCSVERGIYHTQLVQF